MNDSKDFVANGTGCSAEYSDPSTYSDDAFWAKVKRFAKKAGAKVIYLALLLYYALISPNTPGWAKTAIISALAYFICPIDLIPDAIPIIGFTDDLAALVAAYKAVKVCVTPDVVAKAKAKASEWFGMVEEIELA
ncbi:MAG: DUF1232 domain-containing protein [Bacteroidales bacterium]|nr:DUF1232 domain-containing protein [Bacteroidales bacterium]